MGIDPSGLEKSFKELIQNGNTSSEAFLNLFEPRKLLFTRKYSKVIDFLKEKTVFMHLYKVEKVYDDASFEVADTSRYCQKLYLPENDPKNPILPAIAIELQRFDELGSFSPIIGDFLRVLGLPEEKDSEKIKALLMDFFQRPFTTVFKE